MQTNHSVSINVFKILKIVLFTYSEVFRKRRHLKSFQEEKKVTDALCPHSLFSTALKIYDPLEVRIYVHNL